MVSLSSFLLLYFCNCSFLSDIMSRTTQVKSERKYLKSFYSNSPGCNVYT